MSEKCRVVKWVKTHKTELMVVGTAVFGTVLLVKNWDSMKKTFKVTEPFISDKVKIGPLKKDIAVPVISHDILDNLAGTMLTARDLGNKVWCSAQVINKHIVSAGLATKLPSGQYTLTEAGRMLGKHTWKSSAAGHSFSNIEWDEKILEVIFSPEELLDIAEKQERARQIFVA